MSFAAHAVRTPEPDRSIAPLSLVEKPIDARPFRSRAAFLLNANARAVSPRLAERLAEVVPQGDLFFSRSFEDAEAFLTTILRRGYGRLFVGGGDGSLVSAMNLVRRLSRELGLEAPKIGLLKLGTGNAMARVVGAKDALGDAAHVVGHGEMTVERVDMVVCEDGTLTPFAGIGYDGEILNDYFALKHAAKSSFAHHVVESVWGYLAAVLLRTVPKKLREPAPIVRITSSQDAYRVVPGEGGDEEILVPAGTVLYEGPAPIVSVGSIPYFGYGFTMFPFARKKAGYMQLRACAVSIPTILANLWPSVWKGSFRHPKLHDFLVKDVVIEGTRALAYEVGGDARGYAQRLSFKVSEEPVEMLALGPRVAPKRNMFGLLPPPSPRKA